MGQTAGVENHRLPRVGGQMNPVQQFGFAIALPHNSFDPKLRGLTLDKRGQLLMRGVAVDVGLALAEPAQVRTVEDVDCHGHQASASG